MDCFVRAANIAHYKKLIAESQRDPSRDETRHATLLRLLAEEMAKEGKPPNGQTFASLLSMVLTVTTVLNPGLALF